MSASTTRLNLTYPVGTDNVSAYPPVDAAALGVLDNAVMWQTTTFATRPNAATVPAGTIHRSSDTSTTALSDGTNWHTLGLDASGATAGTAPIGAIQQYAGSSDPIDPDSVVRWLICDGRAVGRTTYATLFSTISTTYGNGNNTTTFNIPNLVGKYAFGKDSSGTGSGLASSFGTKDHTHSIGALSVPGLSIPSLTVGDHFHVLSSNGGAMIALHGIPDGTKFHFNAQGPGFTSTVSVFDPYTPNADAEVVSSVALLGVTNNAGVGATGTGTTGSGSTSSTTSGAGNPPSLAVNHIIRVL